MSIEGQSACTPCPAGYNCAAEETVNPVACPRGHYCLAPAKTFDATLAADKASATDIEVTKNPCPAGTYNSFELAMSLTDCLDCPPGKYCTGGEQSFTGLCTKGYVCTGKQSVPNPSNVFTFADYDPLRSGPCPIGHYCPTGSSFPVPCAAGTYQNEKGNYVCKSCDKYKFCGGIKLSAPSGSCALGYECLGGAIYARPNDYQTGKPCKKGSYCQGGRSR